MQNFDCMKMIFTPVLEEEKSIKSSQWPKKLRNVQLERTSLQTHTLRYPKIAA